MASWRKALVKVGSSAEQQFDKLKFRLDRRLGGDEPILIQPYRWYGTSTSLSVRGRVLAYNGIRAATDNDTLWENLANAYRRFNSNEIPFARVRVEHNGAIQELVADDEGYFQGEIVLGAADSDRDTQTQSNWQHVKLTLVHPTDIDEVVARAPVMVPSASAQFGVISDIDDTVLQTHATNWLKAAQLTFLGNARMRLPFPGVGALYRALVAGSDGQQQNPLFYVSSSPWNLYDLLIDFMALHEIPEGPLCLRDLGLNEETGLGLSHKLHKLGIIEQILRTYPEMKFVLIGDSGQQDPEVYAEIARNYPDRVLAVYIRDVTDDDRDDEVMKIQAILEEIGENLLLVPDSLVAAEHAAELGLIPPNAVASIAAAMHVDDEE